MWTCLSRSPRQGRPFCCLSGRVALRRVVDEPVESACQPRLTSVQKVAPGEARSVFVAIGLRLAQLKFCSMTLDLMTWTV